MKETVKAHLYTCDGCGSVHLVEVSAHEPPFGYHGQHSQIGEWGAIGGSWFACRRDCILTAIDVSEASN